MTVFLFPATSYAVVIEVVAVHNFFERPSSNEGINPYGIILGSHSSALTSAGIRPFKRVKGELLYQLKVKVNEKVYYRLVLGNFPSRRLAQTRLNQVKGIYTDAWIGKRLAVEKKLLAEQLKGVKRTKAAKPTKTVKSSKTAKTDKVQKSTTKAKSKASARTSLVGLKPDALLKRARHEFFEHNYDRVISIANRVMEFGDRIQQQQALELAAVARERQQNFDQAIVLYLQFLKRYPESKFRSRIEVRLQGLETMVLVPQENISRPTETVQWDIRGALSQYYSDDILDRGTINSESFNNVLVTNLDTFASRKSEQGVLAIRFDGGFVNDLVDSADHSRVNLAMVSYANNQAGYHIFGGRQSRTANGIYGRFDGLVYNQRLGNGLDYSLFTGFAVESSSDDVDSDRPFVGGGLGFEPVDGYDVDVYINFQNVDGLIDRQAVGAEVQHRLEKGFIFGVLDYDIYYNDLNNARLVTNYQIDNQWILNLSLDFRNSPLLTTTNAVQGQPVNTIDELQNIFTEQQIYDLAEDRTSKSQNLFFGASYQIDSIHQLYMSFSYSTIEETVASGNVAATEAIDDISISADYSVRGYLFDEDFSTVGIRLSDTSSAQTLSVSMRSRFPGPGDIRYDPKIRLDFRTNNNTDVDQVVLSPSIRMTYQFNKQINFEASLGIEYSHFDQSESEDQTIYAIFVGYLYQF